MPPVSSRETAQGGYGGSGMQSNGIKTPKQAVHSQVQITTGSPLGAQACNPPFIPPAGRPPVNGSGGAKPGRAGLFSMGVGGVSLPTRRCPLPYHHTVFFNLAPRSVQIPALVENLTLPKAAKRVAKICAKPLLFPDLQRGMRSCCLPFANLQDASAPSPRAHNSLRTLSLFLLMGAPRLLKSRAPQSCLSSLPSTHAR